MERVVNLDDAGDLPVEQQKTMVERCLAHVDRFPEADASFLKIAKHLLFEADAELSYGQQQWLRDLNARCD